MPAGDLLTADWQFELNGVLMGAGTNFTLDKKTGFVGLGPAPRREQDLVLEQADGEVLGRTTRGARLIKLPLIIVRVGSATNAWSSFGTLRDAWDAIGVTELHWQLPSWGHRKVVGEPRGFTEGPISDAISGVIPVLCEFKAHNPTIYTG